MDKVIVNPETKNPTHHISLTDENQKTIGLIIVDDKGQADELALIGNPTDRTPLKFSEGQERYSDLVYPWSTIAQEDWSNGRAQDVFEDDSAAFYDSRGMWTMNGEMMLAGLEQYTKGTRDQNLHQVASVQWTSLLNNDKYMAVKFTASASYNVNNIYLLIRRVGTPTTAITVALCSDSSGNPGSTLQSTTVDTDDITDVLAEYYKVVITSQAVTSGTDYWIKISSTGGSESDHWKIGTEDNAGTTKYSSDGSVWSSAGYDIFYRATDADGTNTAKLFQYRYMQWMVINKGIGVQPDVYYHGDYGVADANTGALGTLVDATKSGQTDPWVADEFIGCIVWIIKGPGSQEEKPYRTITDNDTTTLTVDEDWVIEHTTETEYVIIGGPAKWRERDATDINLAADPVTDIKIFNGAVYFCQGDDNNIHRFQWYQDSNALAHRDADDGTNKAVFLESMLDNTDGHVIWKANNEDANDKRSVDVADTPTTWANMTFSASEVLVDEDSGKVNLIKAYSDNGTRQLWIFTEGMIYKINNGKLDPIPLEELKALMHYTNAQCAITHNVYMIFPWGNGGMQRYYDLNLDDLGPNRGEGMPANRQGYIKTMQSYPDKYFAGLDAGSSGYSTVLTNTGSDHWHEIYRAPATGERIWGIQHQTVPDGPNRLWVAMGSDILYIPIPHATINPKNDSSFIYRYESHVESSWIHDRMPDVWKFFHSIKLWAEQLVEDTDGSGGVDVEMQVKWDNETTWLSLTDKYHEMPSQEINIKSVLGVSAKRIKYRAILRTNDSSTSPIVKAVVMECVKRIKVKYAFSFRVRVKDNDILMNGNEDELTGREKVDIIKNWIDSIAPLRLRTLDYWSDDKTVFLQPVPYQKNKKTEDSWIVQGGVVEI